MLILITISVPPSVASLPYSEYTNKFNLSGKLIQANVQEFPLNGELEIKAEANSTYLEYNLDYFALIPSLFDTYGSATYSENITSKLLFQNDLNSTALSVIWNIFTYGIENVQSIFRITDQEVNSMETSLLNYSAVELRSQIFSSPQLGAQINSYYVELDLPDIQYQIFYDARNLILIGLNVFMTSEALQYNFDVELRADISQTSLNLEKVGDLNELATLKYVAGGIIFVGIMTIMVYVYLRRSKTIVSGGL